MASSREVIQRLLAEGWVEQPRSGGSHRQFKRDGKPLKVTVPHPVKDIPKGTLRNIHRAAGWEWPPQ